MAAVFLRLLRVPCTLPPQGLLDFAFSPLFGENGFFYLSYSCELDDGVSVPIIDLRLGWCCRSVDI